MKVTKDVLMPDVPKPLAAVRVGASSDARWKDIPVEAMRFAEDPHAATHPLAKYVPVICYGQVRKD